MIVVRCFSVMRAQKVSISLCSPRHCDKAWAGQLTLGGHGVPTLPTNALSSRQLNELFVNSICKRMARGHSFWNFGGDYSRLLYVRLVI